MNAATVLETKIHATIPLAQAMQFHIESLDLDGIEVSAPLAPNVNIHGTGFAGSIYSVAVLCGWALCTHILEAAGIDADLVVARAEIRYRAPVTGELRCRAGSDAPARETWLEAVRHRGKGVLPLEIKLGERPQAVLQAEYCAILRD